MTGGSRARDGVTAPLSGTARYLVADEPGAWRYVGQATYVEDDGREVEHDHVRMAQVGTDREVWVPLADVVRASRKVTGAA